MYLVLLFRLFTFYNTVHVLLLPGTDVLYSEGPRINRKTGTEVVYYVYETIVQFSHRYA